MKCLYQTQIFKIKLRPFTSRPFCGCINSPRFAIELKDFSLSFIAVCLCPYISRTSRRIKRHKLADKRERRRFSRPKFPRCSHLSISGAISRGRPGSRLWSLLDYLPEIHHYLGLGPRQRAHGESRFHSLIKFGWFGKLDFIGWSVWIWGSDSQRGVLQLVHNWEKKEQILLLKLLSGRRDPNYWLPGRVPAVMSSQPGQKVYC